MCTEILTTNYVLLGTRDDCFPLYILLVSLQVFCIELVHFIFKSLLNFTLKCRPLSTQKRSENWI